MKRYKIDWGLALTIAAALAMVFLNVFEQLHINEVQDGQEQFATPKEVPTEEVRRKAEDLETHRRTDPSSGSMVEEKQADQP